MNKDRCPQAPYGHSSRTISLSLRLQRQTSSLPCFDAAHDVACVHAVRPQCQDGRATNVFSPKAVQHDWLGCIEFLAPLVYPRRIAPFD